MVMRWACLVVMLAALLVAGAGTQSAVASSGKGLSEAIVLRQDEGPLLPPETVPPPETNPPSGDQDGMLPDVMNPDDDGDGVQDADDSAPNDPKAGSLPPTSPTDSGADSDDDGLPNVMDPDDNNNGVQDADDPVSLDPAGNVPAPTPTPVPEKQAPVPAASEPKQSIAQESVAPSGGNERPAVLALPSTGVGQTSGSLTVAAMLTSSAVILTLGGFLIRRRCS